MRARTVFVPAVIIAALALSGCTSTPSTPATTAAATPATADPVLGTATPAVGTQDATPAEQPGQVDAGGRVTGNGYSFTAPKGWQTGSAPGTDVLVQPADASTKATAIGVTITPYTESLTSYEDEVYKDGAGRGTVPIIEKRVSLDGVEAAHLSLALGDGPSAVTFDQLFALTSGTGYQIVFSSTSLTEQQRDAILQQIIETWKWE